MYRPDMSSLGVEYKKRPIVYAGWLDKSYPYPQGTMKATLVDKLLLFCNDPLVCTMGMYDCPFPPCDKEESPVFGSCETAVIGKSYLFWIPSMMHHYVVAHHYLPPAEFLTALQQSPLPNSCRYWWYTDKITSLFF